MIVTQKLIKKSSAELTNSGSTLTNGKASSRKKQLAISPQQALSSGCLVGKLKKPLTVFFKS